MSNLKRITVYVMISIIVIGSMLVSGCGKTQPVTEDVKQTVSVDGMEKKKDEYKIYDITDEQKHAFSEAVNNFSAELLAECIDGNENVLVSPISVMFVLGMLANGARGDTEKQIESAVYDNIALDALNKALNNYITEAVTDKNKELQILDSVWYNEKIRLASTYQDVIKKYYTKKILGRKFNKNTLDEINEWVSDTTGGKIDKLFDHINESDLVCIINTILFSSNWSEVGRENAEDEFTAADGTKQSVHYLDFSARAYKIADESVAKNVANVVAKRYDRSNYAFVALLPNEGVSAIECARALTGEQLAALTSNASGTDVDVRLPEFESKASYDMKAVLEKMGIVDVFDAGKADLSGMVSSESGMLEPYISKIVHKSYIKVDKNGTTAAAASGAIVAPGSAPSLPLQEITFDRPFVYVIMDVKNDIPVFIGIQNSIK